MFVIVSEFERLKVLNFKCVVFVANQHTILVTLNSKMYPNVTSKHPRMHIKYFVHVCK